MVLSQVYDRVGDSDLDFHAVSQLSTLGVLADDVVGDLIMVRAGVIGGSESQALRRAASLFRMVADAAPVRAELWDSDRLSDALRVISTSQGARPSAEVPDDLRSWARDIASGLEAVGSNDADEETLARLERQFSQLSAGTLAASNDAVRQRGYASSWLTL